MPDRFEAAQEINLREIDSASMRARLPDTVSAATECSWCGDPISEERRAAVPHTDSCVFCAREREQNARHYRPR